MSVDVRRQDLHGLVDSLQLMRAPRLEPNAASRYKISHDVRRENLVRNCAVGDAAGKRHCDASDVIASLFHLADVNARRRRPDRSCARIAGSRSRREQSLQGLGTRRARHHQWT